MNLLLAAAEQSDRWHAAFAALLPDATIHRWPGDAPAEVDCALVWKPPPEVFRRVRVRRAIFNLGAGVDALLAVDTLPRDGWKQSPQRAESLDLSDPSVALC